jgi:hypothetical protein
MGTPGLRKNSHSRTRSGTSRIEQGKRPQGLFEAAMRVPPSTMLLQWVAREDLGVAVTSASSGPATWSFNPSSNLVMRRCA